MAIQSRTVALMSAVFLLSACAATTPNYDARFADSVRMAQARHTADAGATARPRVPPPRARTADAAPSGEPSSPYETPPEEPDDKLKDPFD